jgi:hypothetical protein
MTDDNDDDRGRLLAAQAKLYNAALDSDVTVVATNWLCRAYLLTEIAGDNIEAAKDVIHTDAGRDAADREYKSMDDAARNEFLTTIGLHWFVCVKKAVQQLWHACGVLDIDPESLDEDHVALHAATLLSRNDTFPAETHKAA